MTLADETIIFVELLGEGTACWRPVRADHREADLYSIIGDKPDDEVWAFSTGDTVKCRTQTFQSGGSGLVAFEKVKR